MSQAILKRQKVLGDGIKSRYAKFQQTAIERKNKVFLEEKFNTLEQDWKDFVANHQLLQEATDLDGGHDYFVKEYYESIETAYQEFIVEIQEAISELDRSRPIVQNQQAYELPKNLANLEQPSSALPMNPANLDQPSYDLLQNHLDGLLFDTTVGNNIFQQDPAISGIPLNLNNLFKAASEQNSRNDSMGAFNTKSTTENKAVQVLVSSLETLLTRWHDEMDGVSNRPKLSKEEMGVLREIIIKRWDIIQSMQSALITKGECDIQQFCQLEKKVIPVLIQERQQKTRDTGNRQSTLQSTAKMPKLSIPVFSGDYVKWNSFKELFLRLIGNKDDLDGCEKLAYLQGQLEGEPLGLIKTLPLVNASYDTAWNILSERFENTHVIVSKLYEQLLNGEQMKKFSIQSMKQTMDRIRECVDTLVNMKFEMSDTYNYNLYYLIESQIDRPTLSLYENTLTPSSKPRRYDDLMRFLKQRIQNLSAKGEAPQKTHPKNNNNGYKREKTVNVSTSLAASSTKANVMKKSAKCGSCKENHFIHQCPVFAAMSPEERYKKVRELKRCINCLRDGHTMNTCKSRACNTCNKKHNSLLHDDKKMQKSKNEKASALCGTITKKVGSRHVFLATAIIEIQDVNGRPVKARALLDSGSQINLITEKMHRKLGLNHQIASMTLNGIGALETESKKRTTIKINSTTSGYETYLELFVIKQITTYQPLHKVEINNWKIPKNISLADPQFNIPAPVDISIGGELFFKLISIGLISIGEDLPDLQNTVFGWVVAGKSLNLERNQAFVGITTEKSLEQQVSQFWKIEEKVQEEKPMTQLELNCEKFFDETTMRNKNNGRFIVKLQFTRDPSILGQSEQMAVRRFFHLEKKFSRDPEMKHDYMKFMKEYEDLGHMERVRKNSIMDDNYFIPHHGIRNPGSSTTKFRVVFDASAKTTSNIALNEILANGPMLQQDLFSIMARFRMHTFVFSADITKMYRKVEVDPNHQKWQMIVWRENPNQQLKYCKLKTLTYGTTCASYLAIKALQTLADEHVKKYPLAAIVAKRDFNVDDVMTGSNDLKEAIILQEELIKLCLKGDFHLHKWCSNHPALLDRIPKSKQEISLDFNAEKTETKALGMKWVPKTDLFMLSYTPRPHTRITKRTVLSETAQLFDPLGLVNPVIVLAKIFMQELWELKLDWDAALPMALHSKWSEFRKELPKLNKVKLPRHVLIDEAVDIQLHAFADASTRAYGGVFYLRSVNSYNKVKVNLICSKSIVAPISATTLPRLELCAGVTIIEMAKKLNKILGINISSTTYWTDSELVLSWIQESTSFKTFVANRVSYIARNSTVAEWKYINTKENPADLISRGVLPEKLLKSKLWWHGPDFLQKKESEWPRMKPAFSRDPTEERTIKTVLTTVEKEVHFIDKIQHRNSIRVLQRVVAYMLRFNHRIVKRNTEMCAESATLSIDELQAAMVAIIRHAQNTCFEKEIQLVLDGNGNKTKFSNFVPIIDANGVLRVGGRLQAANIPFEQKHPALLPKDHYITRLIMERAHLANMHAGPQALLAIIRQRYWPENGKRLSQKIVKNCVLCARSKPILMEQIMGKLPADRVNVARAFSTVGLDFAGPITIHHKIRGKRTRKAYICVFACFTTKAVHLEAANDLTTEGFVNCLKRFIARRAAPTKIICDNATNFRGLYNQLTELTELMNDNNHQAEVIKYCQDHEIEWKFAPPRSPHFNGLAEAAVKSAKLHVKKVIHSMELTYDEFATILAEVEAILNSRPLSSMSNDPNDLQPITPGHFLVGKPLTCINDTQVPYTSKTKMWHKIVGLRNEFWKRWSKEYIAELQSRNKRTTERDNIKIGTLVIIRDDNLPPLKWKMGRVTNIIQDDNGKTRVVDLHTSTTNMEKAKNKNGKIDIDRIMTRNMILRRAIHRICPLPIETETTTQEQQEKVIDKRLPENMDQVAPGNKPESIAKSKAKKPITTVSETVEPIARRTRSKKFANTNNLFVMLLALAAIIHGVFGIQCNYTSFSHNPGLYFEQQEKMSLTNDKWNIISYMKLEPFCDQVDKINKLLDQLDKLCAQMEPAEYCNITTQQLRLKAKTTADYNELILGFSQHSLIRKRRECTDSSNLVTLTELLNNTSNIFNQRKNQIKSSKNELLKEASILSKISQNILKNTFSTENTIQKIVNHEWKLSKEKVVRRSKRGWANFIGSTLKVVGGVMDDDDAVKLENQINQLNISNQHMAQLISHQTSIQDITENIMKREATAITEHLSRFEAEINSLKDGNQTTKFDIYNIMALQTLMVIISHKETQNSIIDLMAQIHHGKSPITLISPIQLKKQLELISSKIGKDIMIPGSANPEKLIQIYSILEATIKITSQTLIIKTTLPLIHREYFDIYHIIPLPFMNSGTSMQMIETSQHYIGINKLLDRYYLLSHNEKAECKAFSEELIICDQKHILYTVKDNVASCEMAIFTHPAKGISPKCRLKEFKPVQVWSKLMTPNQFVFTVPKPVTFNIICENESTICTASGSGIISLPQHCIIQTNNMEIIAENIYQSEGPTLVVPGINISNLLQESINFTYSVNEIFKVDPQYKELENAIKAQKDEAELISPTISWHDVHHYAATYTILTIIVSATIVVIWAIKKYKCNKFIPMMQNESIENGHAITNPIAQPRNVHSDTERISFS